MELDDLKETWQHEKQVLENRIRLDEELINRLTFDKSKGVFDRLMTTAIMGRNMALVYMLISFAALYFMKADLWQNVLVSFGGLAMLFSFFQHRSLKKPEFSQMNTIELQKAISKFRIHTAKNSKYDTAIVALWFSSMIPIYMRLFMDAPVSFWNQLLISAVIVVLMLLFTPLLYGKWDQQLKENELLLKRTMAFETED